MSSGGKSEKKGGTGLPASESGIENRAEREGGFSASKNVNVSDRKKKKRGVEEKAQRQWTKIGGYARLRGIL